MTDGMLLAVDGGATCTRARLCRPDGTVMGEGTAGPSSLTLGVDQAWRNIAEAATVAAHGTLPLGVRLAAGLAGARSPENRAAFRAQDRLACREIRVVTDGYASLLGALGGEPGTVLAVGTGVTAYALRPDGTTTEASGWGFPAGDEGGGAWIGHRALQAYLKFLDRRRPSPSRLFDAVPRLVGGDFDSVQRWLRGATATTYAALAPAVVDAARAGDTLAGGILDAAAIELDETIAAVERGGNGGPLALLGGLAETLAPRLASNFAARLVAPRGSALDGLLLVLADADRVGLT